ncbi:MAG TPA: DNA-3-methyladenine glycosylase I [Kofleriaceae bacterium]|nr:DNA-3-methyladenine glycosylase I [Kofleriaceae bacterium]
MTAKQRCAWAAKDNMHAYHDTEWGVPVHDDRKHFEFLILEGAQAGLSWSTILDKREGYRRAFAGFDPEQVARFTPARIAKILQDPGIVRNRLKVECAVSNARAFLKLREERGSFDEFLWEHVGGKPIVNRWKHTKQIPPRSAESDAVAAELKKRGFKFAGSTIMYAHMQACGLVNDHLIDCFRWRPCQKR